MLLFGLEGSGFIISLGITLLLVGAVMFYILKRFAIIEENLIENARILQAYIINNKSSNLGNLENPIALESALNELNNKIDVSDNGSEKLDNNQGDEDDEENSEDDEENSEDDENDE